MTTPRVPRTFLIQAVVIGLGGVIAAPAMIAVMAAGIYKSQIGNAALDPLGFIFGGAGIAILWLAIRALRRGDGETWRGERWLRYALAPCLAIGVAAGGYLVYRIHRADRYLIERDAGYLCHKLQRTDDRCLDAAEKCRGLIGRDTARTTGRDDDCLACMGLELAKPR